MDLRSVVESLGLSNYWKGSRGPDIRRFKSKLELKNTEITDKKNLVQWREEIFTVKTHRKWYSVSEFPILLYISTLSLFLYSLNFSFDSERLFS